MLHVLCWWDEYRLSNFFMFCGTVLKIEANFRNPTHETLTKTADHIMQNGMNFNIWTSKKNINVMTFYYINIIENPSHK